MSFQETPFKVVKSVVDLEIFFNVLYFKKIDFKFTVQLSKIPIYATSFSYNIVVLSLIKDNPQDS